MENAATQSKQRWNGKNYAQVKVSVKPDIASAFKEACVISNVSMASKLSQFMAEYSNFAISSKDSPDLSTRQKRRIALKALVLQLDQIMIAEQRCRDNTPSNLQGSVVFDTADQYVSSLEDAIELLSCIY